MIEEMFKHLNIDWRINMFDYLVEDKFDVCVWLICSSSIMCAFSRNITLSMNLYHNNNNSKFTRKRINNEQNYSQFEAMTTHQQYQPNEIKKPHKKRRHNFKRRKTNNLHQSKWCNLWAVACSIYECTCAFMYKKRDWML